MPSRVRPASALIRRARLSWLDHSSATAADNDWKEN
jgi:hypothetical protein